MSDLSIILIMGLVFGACALLVVGASLLWSDIRQGREKKERRLRHTARDETSAASANSISLTRREVASPITRSILGKEGQKNLQRKLRQAGDRTSPAGVLLKSVLEGVAGASALRLLVPGADIFTLLLGFAIGASIPWLMLSRKRNKRRQLIIKQLPDAMDFFARSMRAGHPFASALKSAAEEIPQPLAGELEATFDELNYGLDFEECMQNLAARSDCEEVSFFATAVLVQKSTGGNLAELMNRIAALLRERVRARGEVMIQAAEMKGSARILIGLPIGVACALQLVNPEYLPVLLENGTGRIIVLVQLLLVLTGYLVIQRMINFRI